MTIEFHADEGNDLAPLALYPPMLTDWTIPVEGYDGGISVGAVERGLRFVIDPWLMMSIGDRLELFWGDTQAAVWSKTLEDGEPNESVRGTIEAGHIVRGDAFPVFYKVTRVGQNAENSTPLLKVLVKLDRPGGFDDDLSTPGHSNLKYVIPQAIIDNGVSPIEAEQGVPIRITPYPYMRKNDRVRFAWGSAETSVTVTQAQVDDPVAHPLIVTIDKAMIEKAGDGPAVALAYQVIDEVGNYPDERSPWSAIRYLLVDLKQNRLDAPLVLEADPVTNVIDLDTLGDQDVTVHVNTTGGSFKVGDTVSMTWFGTPAKGSPVIEGPLELPVVRVGIAVTFPVPNAKVRAIAKGRATASYVLKRAGVADRPSKIVSVSVEGEINPLQAPEVIEAPGGTLDPSEPWATVSIPYYPGRQGSDQVTLIWQAHPPSTAYYEDPRPVGNLPEHQPILRSVPNADIQRFDGLKVDVYYRVANDDMAVRSVRDSLRYLLQVGAVQPQLTLPRVREVEPGSDRLDPDKVPPTGATLFATYLGTRAGDRVTYHWRGSASDGSTSDYVDLTSHSAGKEVPFTIARPYVINNLGGSVTVDYSITRDGKLLGRSLELTLRVGSAQLELKPPSVKEAPDNVNLNPIAAKDRLTVVVPQGELQLTDQVSVTWTGAPGTPAGGSHTSNPQLVSAGLSILIDKHVVAFNLNKTVSVSYTVTRNGTPQTSAPFVLNVQPIPDQSSALPTPVVPQAPGADLDLASFVGDARITVAPWPLIAAGQRVWLSCEGRAADGTSTTITLWRASPVNGSEANNGLSKAIARDRLELLRHDSTLRIILRVSFDGGGNVAQAVQFPVLSLVMRIGVHGTPAFTNAPYTVAPLGQVKDIGLSLVDDDKPVPKGYITLTLPAGVTYADGGVGARDFITDTAGIAMVSGVKGASAPGNYTLTAASGAQRATAPLVIAAPGTIIGTIPVGDSPYGVAVSPDGARVYVCNSLSDTVSVIDATRRTVIGTISVGAFPSHVAISPDGARVYVCNMTANTVSVIDAARQAVIGIISAGGSPGGVAVSPDGARLYVINVSGGSVSVIDTANQIVIRTIALAGGPYGIAISPDGTRVYVSIFFYNTISVIDTASLTVIRTIATGGYGVIGVAVSPDGARVYVGNQNSTYLSVIDAASQTVIRTIAVGNNPSLVAVSPDSTRIYVCNYASHTVSVIDAASLTVIRTIAVGKYPLDAAFSPDGALVYVCNSASNNISVITGG